MKDIYLLIEGQQLGPYTEEQVRRKLYTGQITPKSQAWHDGLTEWQTLESLLISPPFSVPPKPTMQESNFQVPSKAENLLPRPSDSHEKDVLAALKKSLDRYGKKLFLFIFVVLILACARPYLLNWILTRPSVLSSMNEGLPRDDGAGTRIDSITVTPNNVIHVHTTMTEIDDSPDPEQLRAIVRPRIVENLRTSLTRFNMCILYLGVCYEYDLYNSNEVPIVDIEIGLSDIK